MSLFSKHKIKLADIFREIPEEELSLLSIKTKVDYCSKVLYGKLMFYLLLYGILTNNRLSQRGLSDSFSSPWFRTLFNFRGKKEISHSSISERLNVINISFFERCYTSIYQRFSSLYTEDEICGMSLQRVDSSLVREVGNKLKEGLTCGNSSNKSKMLKYTINYDGMFGSFSKIHKESSYTDECKALSENVLDHFKKAKDHSLVYLFDRGQACSNYFCEMQSQENLFFVGRLKENRKMLLVNSLLKEEDSFEDGLLLEDGLYRLYTKAAYTNKKGTISYRVQPSENTFRIIRFQVPGKKESIVLITNILDLSADHIAKMYRRRWDIEVFFRFLKQELNFSHFLSLSDNGIRVILYMTLITAMLVMIYKKENELGYKTAIRRIKIELEALVMAIVVIQSGGDLKKTELPDP